MLSIIGYLIFGVFGFVQAERNIIPSPDVCASFPNEEFAIDIQRCQNTCEYYGRTWDCPSYKPYGDCYCKNGFARLKEDGNCVSVTKNAKCVAKLPISEESCTGPNEFHQEYLQVGSCDKDCFTFGCRTESELYSVKWGPHCECLPDFRRLKNGTCVSKIDPQCVAEYQPSPERCSAIGQIYQEDVPCHKACFDEIYCPPKGATCVCPSNRLRYSFTDYLRIPGFDEYQNEIIVLHEIKLMKCLKEMNCLPTTTTPRPAE